MYLTTRKRCFSLLSLPSLTESDWVQARLNKQKEAEILLEKARKAAEEAEKAQQKAASLKGSELDKFAEFARKYSKEKQMQDLKNQAESKAEEAARLAAAADKAERERGTTTLAQKYAEKSREAILEADDAERRIATSDLQHHAEAAHDYALTYEAVIESLKDVRLVPVTGSRTDISRTTDALDDLKVLLPPLLVSVLSNQPGRRQESCRCGTGWMLSWERWAFEEATAFLSC